MRFSSAYTRILTETIENVDLMEKEWSTIRDAKESIITLIMGKILRKE